MTYIYRYQPATVHWSLQRATKGTVWMPRDIFISSARGRAFLLTTHEGVKFFPMPYVVDVSESLDTVGQFAGVMMYRGPELWTPIPLGDDGNVLTVVGDQPQWMPGGGGGASYLRIPIWANQNTGRKTDCNSITYMAAEMLSFYVDGATLPFNQFRFVGHFGSNAFGQTIYGQVARWATPGTPLSAAGDDFSQISGQTFQDTGWIDVVTPITSMERLVVGLRGSNATVDLMVQFMELHLRVN